MGGLSATSPKKLDSEISDHFLSALKMISLRHLMFRRPAFVENFGNESPFSAIFAV